MQNVYLIQPRFFDSLALGLIQMRLRRRVYMDDMWISGCLERRGVEKYVIPASNMMRTDIRSLAP